MTLVFLTVSKRKKSAVNYLYLNVGIKILDIFKYTDLLLQVSCTLY